MDKNVLTLIGIIAICGTILFVVDKQTSQSSQSQQNEIVNNNSTKKSSPPNFEGYTLMGESDVLYFYLKNGSADSTTLNSDRGTSYLWGGVVRTEHKNGTQPTQLYKFYIKEYFKGTYSQDCEKGYGALYHYSLSNVYQETSEWATDVNNFTSFIGTLLCKEYKQTNGQGVLKQTTDLQQGLKH